jgi:DNA-binding NarL/FixJ family response regulator
MKRLHVLIIDDDRIYALGLKFWLRGLGMAGRTRACDAVPYDDEYESPDLAIIDPLMAGVPYVSLIREVKRRFPLCRIIVCSRSHWFEDGFAGRAMEAGADAFYCKGQPDDELFVTMLSLMESKLTLDSFAEERRGRRSATAVAS